MTNIGKWNIPRQNLKEMHCSHRALYWIWKSSAMSVEQVGRWHHFMLWHCFDARPFLLSPKWPVKRQFSTFCRALTKQSYSGSSWHFFPRSPGLHWFLPHTPQLKPHILPAFQNYWGLWVGLENKERAVLELGGGLRNHISLPPKYQLFSQPPVLLWKRDN